MHNATHKNQRHVRHVRAVVSHYDADLKFGRIATDQDEHFAFNEHSVKHIASDIAEGEHVVAEIDKDNLVVELRLSILS